MGCVYIIDIWSMDLFCHKLVFLKDNNSNASSLKFPDISYLGKNHIFPDSSVFIRSPLACSYQNLLFEWRSQELEVEVHWYCPFRFTMYSFYFPCAVCSCGQSSDVWMSRLLFLQPPLDFCESISASSNIISYFDLILKHHFDVSIHCPESQFHSSSSNN